MAKSKLTDVPGIGEATADLLAASGIRGRAHYPGGQYLYLHADVPDSKRGTAEGVRRGRGRRGAIMSTRRELSKDTRRRDVPAARPDHGK